MLKHFPNLTIAGVDEAGRGPWAGPVVAAAVIVPAHFQVKGELKLVRDSKLVSSSQRDYLAELIKQALPNFGLGVVSEKVIDKINILQATFLAMRQALAPIQNEAELVLIDGRQTLPNFNQLQRAIIDGDAQIFAIAAASIIAKTARDQLMLKYHEQYPHYRFDQHKGYGTALHRELLNKYGPSPIHRLSFKPLSQNENPSR